MINYTLTHPGLLAALAESGHGSQILDRGRQLSAQHRRPCGRHAHRTQPASRPAHH